MWGIWCIVMGGRTGHREAWLKWSGDVRAEFSTKQEAEQEAARLTSRMNGPYATATFTYRAMEIV